MQISSCPLYFTRLLHFSLRISLPPTLHAHYPLLGAEDRPSSFSPTSLVRYLALTLHSFTLVFQK